MKEEFMLLNLLLSVLTGLPSAQNLAGTDQLAMQGDLAARMVEGLGKLVTRELAASIEAREGFWKRDYSSPEAYVQSVAPNREHLLKIIGAVDHREPVTALEYVSGTDRSALVTQGEGYSVYAVRWPVFEGVYGEGLWLEPGEKPIAQIIALPDADWTPEMLVGLSPELPPEAQFARRLAEQGCRVLVPVLIDRSDTWSGNPAIRMTNQPHREFIYRMAFEMGRHIIGYEAQKILAAVDWFVHSRTGCQPVPPLYPPRQIPPNPPLQKGGTKSPLQKGGTELSIPEARMPGESRGGIGVIGYGEGGLLALYSAAADTRIDAAVVSGYFQSRQNVWQEPIYRNVWRLLREFGDAELASLVAPRTLIVEASAGPEVEGPPPPRDGRSGAAPGRLVSPPPESVEAEFNRARQFYENLGVGENIILVKPEAGNTAPGSDAALTDLLAALGCDSPLKPAGTPPTDRREDFDPGQRLHRQFQEPVAFTQQLLRQSVFRRREFWSRADKSSLEGWKESCQYYRDYLWDEVIGRFPPPSVPANPRTRLAYDEPNWKGYEVVLDVWPDVFAYGILLVPKDLKPGERRPVVVCQHGLEGRPQRVVDPGDDESAYRGYGAKLADRGFIVYAPQNPYIGGDKFRVLQRKANPLGRSLFSFIVRQHERTLEWLSEQPFVDAERIGFYGISYGGKTAMRVPALLDRYALSICSADFNEWIMKNVTVDHRYSYMFTGEYEMFEFDLGNTFNYSDLAGLILPRPFMVERGHHDGVAPDEWVAYEYATVRRLYTILGISDRTEIEFFDGGHMINAQGTFEFLHRWLSWPKRERAKS
jgi:dienelactone hydrolase